jgi:RNA polymerase subunit RPABC4/transcription elongation factor Spt4
MYIIGNCPTCGKLMLASTANKTRTCPNCGSHVNILGLKVIAQTNSSQEATRIIQILKEKELRNDNPSFKHFKT